MRSMCDTCDNKQEDFALCVCGYFGDLNCTELGLGMRKRKGQESV